MPGTQVLIFILTLIFALLLTKNISGHTEELLKQEALGITEKQMRERVAKAFIHDLIHTSAYGTETFAVSISIGSSRVYPEDTDYSQATKRADEALYHSKHTGKNRYTSTEAS